MTDNQDDIPIGVTALHKIDNHINSCVSGIIIWDSAWWGKGIASAAHLGRTLFAADYLNRFTIKSQARVENTASCKALERVGYSLYCTVPLSARRAGRWLDTNQYIWINPDMLPILFPAGVPDQYSPGIERAREALFTARQAVEFP